MTIQIEEISNLKAAWADFWPLHDALQQYHAGLNGRARRPNAEAGSRSRLVRLLASKPSKVLLARDGGVAVGIGTARLVEGGWSLQEPVGHLSDFYIWPANRGSRLVFEILRRMEDWLRANGRPHSEHGSMTASSRTIRLSRHLGYRPYLESLRRDAAAALSEHDAEDSAAGTKALLIRRITDLGLDWPKIWPFLERLDQHRQTFEPCELPPNREQFRREEIETALAKKSLLLLVERDGEPCGVAMGQVVENPSITLETVGLISNFLIDGPQTETGLRRQTREKLETWLTGKGVDVLETQILARDQTERSLWTDRSYESYKFELRKDLLA